MQRTRAKLTTAPWRATADSATQARAVVCLIALAALVHGVAKNTLPAQLATKVQERFAEDLPRSLGRLQGEARHAHDG